MRRARVLALGATLLWPALANADAPKARPAVVFYAPSQLEPDMRSALDDALATQLLSVPVDLHFELASSGSDTLEQRLDAVKQTPVDRRALAVFWLEIRRSDRWYLYAVDAPAERVVLRPLSAKPGSYEAAFESVAVIVRATADALLHGQPLAEVVEADAEPVAPVAPQTKPKPADPWPTVQSERKPSELRLAASYMGSTFAPNLLWMNGFHVQAAWVWPTGAFVGLGYTFFPEEFVTVAPVRLGLTRHPIALQAGLRFESGAFTFTGELAAEVELRVRKAEALPGEPNYTPDDTRRVVPSICPKLESEYSVTSWLRVFVGAGLDFVLDNFPYQLMKENRLTLIDPFGVRFTMRAGIAIVR